MGDDPGNRDTSSTTADPDVTDSSTMEDDDSRSGGDGDRSGSTVATGDRSGPTAGASAPGPSDRSGSDGPDPRDGPVAAMRWIRSSDRGAVVFLREILTSVLAVLAVGALLFAISGVWPPMVAVESGSMEPHMQKGDLVFVMDEQRLQPAEATGDTGVVTHAVGVEAGYRSFGDYGDVVIYHPDGDPDRKPVIHRTHFWVEEGENWLSRADPAYVSGDSCDAVPNCPAPHAGFITKGDNERTNNYYDQTRGISEPVKPSWIEGTAEVRVPWLGWVRLTFSDLTTPMSTPAIAL